MKTSQLLSTIKNDYPQFKDDVFGKSYLHWQGGVSNVSEMIDLSELDRVLNENVLDPRNFLLFKNGQQFNSTQIMSSIDSQGLDKEKVCDLIHGQMYSLKIFNIDRYSAPLSALKSEISNFFLRKITFNLYLTPSKTPCFLEHQDNYDILIAQLEGSKLWHLNEASTLIPLNSGETNELIGDAKKVLLKKGDLLYLPPSILHKVENQEDYPALHLTIGIHPLTYEEIFMSMLKDKKSSLFFKQPVKYESTDVQIEDIREKKKHPLHSPLFFSEFDLS